MKYLALIRHGEITGRELSPLGHLQANKLGGRLLELDVPTDKIKIISSPAIRAKQTSYGIAARLNVSHVEEESRLWSGPDGSVDSFEGFGSSLVEWSNNLLEGCNLLVILTHYEICGEAPDYIRDTFESNGPQIHGLSRGQGLLFKIAQKEHQLF
jgi:hypothetical protein